MRVVTAIVVHSLYRRASLFCGRGNDVLGQIFGSKDVSRTVVQNASSQTGVDQNVLKKMLPMLAMMIAGYMARQGGRGTPGHSSQSGGGLGGLLGGASGAGATGFGGMASMLDINRDGNPLDDILRMVGKAPR